MPLLSSSVTCVDPASINDCVLDGMLDGVDLERVAVLVGTPCHVYSVRAIRNRIHEMQAALRGLDAQICFAVKANPLLAILQLMAASGIGADIVSAGELVRALEAGIDPGKIVFSGVGKTSEEIRAAMQARISRFNVESRDELESIQQVAAGLGVVANVAVRINPDVDALTHAKISTGRAENKFGVSIAEAHDWFMRKASLPNLRMNGLHVHIGSQILELDPFRDALDKVARFRRELGGDGCLIQSIDVGGGLGVRYRQDHERPPSVESYVRVIRDALHDFSGQIVLEPGRWLVADAGLMLTRVIRAKQGEERRFLILDAAMNDLPRPSLYDAWHEIGPVGRKDRQVLPYDIVGPVCESGDTLARDRMLPECHAGDLMLIHATGAYAASMASTYNSRPLAAEVLVNSGRYAIVRARQTHAQMCHGEMMANDWLEA